MKGRTCRRSGFVLVVVLVMSCVLALVVGQFAVSTLTDLEVSRARARAAQLRAAADSGIELARAMLAADLARRPPVDSLRDVWAQGPMTVRLGETTVTVTIRDENAKISLPHLMKSWDSENAARLSRAFRMFARSAPRDLKVSAAALRRWVVENQYRLDLPPGPAGAPLFRVEASADTSGRRPQDVLTVWTDGELNVNTAPPECLEYLWGERGERLVRELVRRRKRQPFITADEVFALPGASSALRLPGSVRLTTTSSVFLIEVEAVAGPSRLCRQAVVSRAEPGVPVLYRRTVGDVRVEGKAKEMAPEDFLHGGAA